MRGIGVEVPMDEVLAIQDYCQKTMCEWCVFRGDGDVLRRECRVSYIRGVRPGEDGAYMNRDMVYDNIGAIPLYRHTPEGMRLGVMNDDEQWVRMSDVEGALYMEDHNEQETAEDHEQE